MSEASDFLPATPGFSIVSVDTSAPHELRSHAVIAWYPTGEGFAMLPVCFGENPIRFPDAPWAIQDPDGQVHTLDGGHFCTAAAFRSHAIWQLTGGA